jgi:LAO/AO transport system kinase
VKTVATEGKGITELTDAINRYSEFTRSHCEAGESRRANIARHRILEMLRDRLFEIALLRGVTEDELSSAARMVADRQRDPYSVVDEIIGRLGIAETDNPAPVRGDSLK